MEVRREKGIRDPPLPVTVAITSCLLCAHLFWLEILVGSNVFIEI